MSLGAKERSRLHPFCRMVRSHARAHVGVCGGRGGLKKLKYFKRGCEILNDRSKTYVLAFSHTEAVESALRTERHWSEPELKVPPSRACNS